MSFLRMAAKQSPLNSRMRSGKRMLSGLKTRSVRSGTMSWDGVGEPEHALLDEHAVVADIELLHHEALQARGHLPVDLEPDHDAAAPALQGRLVERDEVFGLLLDLDVAVAQHTEGALAAGDETRKQPRDEHADHEFDADEADRRRCLLGGCLISGKPDEARPAGSGSAAARAWSCHRARAAARRRR